jgi:hypothetical protein
MMMCCGAFGRAATDDPLRLVRDWYATIGPASSDDIGAAGGGTLGGSAGYRLGYRAMSPAFQSRVSVEQFLTLFRHTAFIRLLQAIPVASDSARACIFVEDARDMVLEALPATVLYYGTICTVRTDAGRAIDRLQLEPELSMIALRDGGHGSTGSVDDVARVAVAHALHVRPDELRPQSFRVPFNAATLPSPVLVSYQDTARRVEATLARLQSGQYVALSVTPVSSRP